MKENEGLGSYMLENYYIGIKIMIWGTGLAVTIK